MPCDGRRRPLHSSADALIPILMSLRVMLATAPTRSGAARVGVEAERTLCDSAVSWHSVNVMHINVMHINVYVHVTELAVVCALMQ